MLRPASRRAEFDGGLHGRRLGREVPFTRPDLVGGVDRADRDLSKRAVRLLILRRVADQIPPKRVAGHGGVDVRQLFLADGEEDAAAHLRGDLPEQRFALEGDAGDAADAHDIDRGLEALQRANRGVVTGLALFVVAVGEEDHDVSALDRAEELWQRAQGIEDGRAALRRESRATASAMVCGIVGRPGRGDDRRAKRRDDDPVALAQRRGESQRGGLHHRQPSIQALAGVDEQRERRGDLLQLHEVQRLLDAVLRHREVAFVQPRHVPALVIEHRGFNEHRRDAGLFDDLERREGDAVADDGAGRGFHVHANLARLVGVLVGPLHGVGRTVGVLADGRVVHEEADRHDAVLQVRLHLRHDADHAGHAGAAQRGGDSDRRGRLRRGRCGPRRQDEARDRAGEPGRHQEVGAAN